MSIKIKIITFHSEGHPHDEGLPLSDGAVELRKLVEGQGFSFDVYTPRRMRELNAEELIKRFDERYALRLNPSLHKIGMAAWKPFIMLHALQELNENDILIYSDSNTQKYPGLAKRLEDILAFVDETLAGHSFFVGRERPDQLIKAAHHSNARQILEIGCNTIFACNFPVHIVNRMVVKKQKESLKILLFWLALCMEERFILPPINGELTHPDFRWFCPEQSVLNMILANLVEEGNLPYYYAGIGIDRQGNLFHADNTHISGLSAPTLKSNYIPFEERFAAQIAAAKIYVSTRQSAVTQLLKTGPLFEVPLTIDPRLAQSPIAVALEGEIAPAGVAAI